MESRLEFSYYPGCSLHGSGEEYDLSIRAVLGRLDIGIRELSDWTCCGASSAHILDDSLSILLAQRNLRLSDESGRDVVVPCAACYSRLKFAEKAAHENQGARGGAERQVRVLHIHDLLARPQVLAMIRKKTVRPLTGLTVVPYYGCLSVRPPKVVGEPAYENPTSLDQVIEAVGAKVVRWSYKTDCCGGSFSLSRPDVVRKLSGDLLGAAVAAGGECLAVDCPMCQANLDTRQEEIRKERGTNEHLPVFFITELIALAMGIGDADKWLARHLVDPRELLARKNFARI